MNSLKSRYNRFLLLLIVVLISSVANAYQTREYGAKEMTSNLVTSLIQDKEGYIWIGTEYGLNKFDGSHFTQYYNDDRDPASISDNIIRKLFTDNQGSLWIVTNLGVQKYDPFSDSFNSVKFYEDSSANIMDISESPEGEIFVVGSSGIFTIDKDNLHAIPLNDSLQKQIKLEDINGGYIDTKKRLWLSSTNSELNVIDLKSENIKTYNKEDLNDKRAVGVIENSDNQIFILTDTQLLSPDEKSGELTEILSFPYTLTPYALFKDKAGDLRISTSGHGIWKVNWENNTMESISDVLKQAEELRNDKIFAFLQDQNGNHWIGSYQKGVTLFSENNDVFNYYPLKDMAGDNGNVLRSIYADNHGNVYIGQEKGGLRKINDKGELLTRWLDGLTVTDTYEDKEGNLWVGTYSNGLYYIDKLSGKPEHIDSTGTKRIDGITQDKNGNIYVGIFNEGLMSFSPGSKSERILGNGKLNLINPYINTLFTDKTGKIWIGHYYGIDVYDPSTDKLIELELEPGLRPAIVYAIDQAPDNSIFIGSNKGLFVYKPDGTWERLTVDEGLPDNMIAGVVIADDGTVWASTYKGLAQISPEGEITSYFLGNGLEDNSFLRGVYAYSTNKEVLMGNQDGVTYFKPNAIIDNSFDRGITMTGMQLGDINVNTTTISHGKRIIEKPIDQTDKITVSYLDNTFSLRFSPLDYRDDRNVVYEYRFSDEPKNVWHKTPSGVNEIFLSQLSSGTHKLMVRAKDNSTYSDIKTITIHVTPPWYDTWVAYLCYLVILIGFAFWIWRYYQHKQQAQISEDKIRTFVDISHEIRSPLTLIKGPLDKLLKNHYDPPTTKALRNIERNTNRLLTLVNQILSIRKIEKSQLNLHFSETNLSDFVKDICSDYEYTLQQRNLTLEFKTKQPDLKVWIDRDHFDKVVANLIGNAIKYVGEGGHIEVVVTKLSDETAEIIVRDNGEGIDEEHLKNLFERFYQASSKPASGMMSYGIGLNLAQKIANLHGGRIIGRNRKDITGSEFIVLAPLGKKHINENQIVEIETHPLPSTIEDNNENIVENEIQEKKIRKKTTYRVAVVDDDEDIRNFLKTELGEIYHVQTYPDGQKALEGIVDTSPDLVISDVIMPHMNGLELLKRLKENTKTSHIPVVLLTTESQRASRIKGFGQGADAYVDKPFNIEELEARVAGLIANRLRIKGKFSGAQEQQEKVKKVELKGNDEVLMEKILKAVNERLDDPDFNVEALADMVGLSRVQLHRRMKEMTGITIGDFIRNIRLQQAAELLEKGDTTVSQVTYAVGFANPTHFSSAFKRHFGVTPKEYLNKYNKDKANPN